MDSSLKGTRCRMTGKTRNEFMNDLSNRKARGRYHYFVENIEATNQSPLIRFWLALPMSRTGQQVSVLSLNPPPQEIIEDDINGNMIIFWEIAPSTKSLSFQYDFEVYVTDIEIDIDVRMIKPYDTKSDQYRYYTKSEPWIELSPEIRQKAKEIIQAETNPYLCSKLFYDWVIENMVYVYPKVEDRGAQKSFARLSGDCGEFSFVFIALCRSVGIPARSVTAVWPTESGHAWAEFYVEPYGWLPVDTTIAQVLDSKLQHTIKSKSLDRDYLFGNLYPNRLIVYVGCNAKVCTRRDKLTRVFSFLQPGGGCSYPTSIEFSNISDTVMHAGFYSFDEEIEDSEHIRTKKDREFASSYYHSDDLLRSERDLLKLTKIIPDALMCWFYLGQVYLNLSKWEESIACFRNSLKSDRVQLQPEVKVWVYNLMGTSLLQARNPTEARRVFEVVLALNCDHQNAISYALDGISKANSGL